MKQHVIIAKVKDHDITATYTKVCRSKSGAIKEARELNYTGLIRRYATKRVDTDQGLEFVFVPASKVGEYLFSTNCDCAVYIHVEDLDGNNVNDCCYGSCQMSSNRDELCETRDECNCDLVYPELERRGFTKA